MAGSLTSRSESRVFSAASPARYATFTSRLRALLIDSAVVGGVNITLLLLGELGEGVPGSGRIVWLLVFGMGLLYEPLFIWRRGATIGHAAKHLRVISVTTRKPPGFLHALTRYLIKVSLGLPSFVTIALSRKHQAVHDMITGTTVQLSSSADADVDDYHLERVEGLDVELPSRSRRLAMIVIYLVALFLGLVAAALAIDPEQRCAQGRSCPASLTIATDALSLVWLGLSAGVIVAGWKGFLWGARREIPIDPDSLERGVP